MKDLASRLTTRIEIEQPSEAPDGAGGFTTTWQNFTTIWAEVKSISPSFRGSEILESSQIQSTKRYLITIRYIDNLTEKMRIKIGAKSLNIISSIDPNYGKEIIEIIAEEGVAT